MDGFWQAVKVLAVTALVVAAAAWTAKQTATRMRFAGRGRHLAVVDSISLGLQRGLFLVRLGDRYVVIGLARDNITLLSELGPEALAGQSLAPDGRGGGLGYGSDGGAFGAGGPGNIAARLEALWTKLSGDDRHGQDPRRSGDR